MVMVGGILAVDVGRGTQDIFLHHPESDPENAVQLILPARTVLLADAIQSATRHKQTVVLRGVTMGGGPITRAARAHLEAGLPLMATAASSAAFSDDPEEVAAMGVKLVDEKEAQRWVGKKDVLSLTTADVSLDELRQSLAVWGIDCRPAAVAVAVQDHGAAPAGESDRRFRFRHIKASLEADPHLPRQAFFDRDIPDRFTRMKGVADSLPDVAELMLMDTGFAALLGACADHRVAGEDRKTLVNAGNGHTLAAVVHDLDVACLMEHHTHGLDGTRLAGYLDRLEKGDIGDDEIFADGGHGSYIAADFKFGTVGIRAITGPRRHGFVEPVAGFYEAAPFGSMMQTGCFGLLSAFFMRRPELMGRLGRRLPPILKKRAR